MKNIFFALTIAPLILAGTICRAQGLAINADGAHADTSAILDVKSTTKGALLPRMSKTQRNTIASPAAGLLVYQTDSIPGYYYYSGTAWQLVGNNAGPWTGSGNNIYNNNTGNVGIGTTTPGAQMDIITANAHGVLVRDNAYASIAIYARDSAADATGVYGWVYGTNSIGVRGYSLNGTGIGGTTKYGTGAVGGSSYGTGGSFTSNSGVGGYFSSATGQALVTDQGRVGIGTNAPAAKMEIDAVDTFALLIKDNSDHSTGLLVTGSGAYSNGIYSKVTGSYATAIRGTTNNTGDGVTGSSKYGNGVAGGSSTGPGGYFTSFSGPALVTGTGNVGLGILLPSEQLDINGAIRLGNTTSSNPGTIRFDGTNFQGYTPGGWTNLGAGSSTSLWTSSGSNIYYNSGNVGMGTTAPVEELDVNGAIHIGNTTGTNPGTIRYNGANFQGYTPGGWTNLGAVSSPWTISGSNIYYSTGNVGINNNAPIAGLDVIGSGSTVEAGRFTITSTVNASPAVYGWNYGGGIGVKGISDGPLGTGVQGISTANGTGGYFTSTSGYALVTGNGNSGFGTPSPQQRVDVAGAIRIGNTTANVPGSIRYNGTDFQGYSGGAWTSFGASQWSAAGSNIYNTNTGNIGIGTHTPASKLDIIDTPNGRGTGTINITQQNNDGWGTTSEYEPAININMAGHYAIYGIIINSVGYGMKSYTDYAGIYAASRYEEGIHGRGTGPGATGGYFESDSGAALLTGNGNVGIGTNTPSAKLEVNGTLKFVTGTPGTGKVLTSDASGNATWQAPGVGTFNDTLTSNLFTNSYLISADGTSGIKMSSNGAIVDKGALGSGADLTEAGPGTKMIWYPKKAAFRTGGASLAEWDNSNIGNYSVAMGYGPVANGNQSMAFGSCDATGDFSYAMGNVVNTYGHTGSFAFGDNSATSLTNNDQDNQMMMRFAGGYKLFTNSAATQGLQVTSGGVAKYLNNVAGSYDARSLVDKNYVDSSAFNYILQQNINANGKAISGDTSSNGLRMIGNGILLCKGVNTSSGTVLTESYATSGFSSKMIWYPKKSAFRVGSVNYTQWDDANIGSGSVAMGNSTMANGTGSFAAGSSDTASGQYSVALGAGSTASGQEAFAMGNFSKATGDYSVAFGNGKASGVATFVFGPSVASSLYGIALGYGDTASAGYATVIGNGSTASGDRSIALGTYVSTNGHPGSCIIGDDTHFTYTVLNNDADQQMMMRFGGGYKLYSDEFATMGLQITPGGVAKYFRNVAGSYDSRSLVDRNYVDSSISAIPSGGSTSQWTSSGSNIANSNTGKISIGTHSTTSAKVYITDSLNTAFSDVLDVKSYNAYAYAVKGEDLTTSSSYGGVFGSTNVGNAVKGQSNGNGYGVYGTSTSGIGVYGYAASTTGFNASGGYFECSGNPGTYALLTGTGNVGIGTNAPSVKLEVCGNEKVNGTIQASGTITASAGISCPSDVRYKKDIKTIDSAVIKVMNMRGVTYNWKQAEFPDKNFSDKLQVGVIAQELEKVYPELVFTDENGYKSVDYTRLAPILIEALKQQQQEIEELRKDNAAQKSQVEKMADMNKRLDILEASLKGTKGEISSK